MNFDVGASSRLGYFQIGQFPSLDTFLEGSYSTYVCIGALHAYVLCEPCIETNCI